jgi:uncharacterized metal-binding protein
MKEKNSSCMCGNQQKNRVIYSCSGIGSNVGQLANMAATRLTLEGFGRGSCLAGIGGGIARLITVGTTADERIVIDGCPVACARKIMEDNGLTIDGYVTITDLGIIKTPGPGYHENDVQTVIDAVRNSSQ